MGLRTKNKDRLAHISANSFRYNMTEGIWKEKRIRNAKACSFYWWYMPTSALMWFFFGLIWCVWAAIRFVIMAVGWLFGFTPDTSVAVETDPIEWEWHDYGYDPITKKTHVVAPQHVLMFVLGVLALLFFRGSIPWATIITIAVCIVSAFILVTLIGFIMSRKSVKEAWHRMCPPLEVE